MCTTCNGCDRPPYQPTMNAPVNGNNDFSTLIPVTLGGDHKRFIVNYPNFELNCCYCRCQTAPTATATATILSQVTEGEYTYITVKVSGSVNNTNGNSCGCCTPFCKVVEVAFHKVSDAVATAEIDSTILVAPAASCCDCDCGCEICNVSLSIPLNVSLAD